MSQDEIRREFLTDILVAAIEGGIVYWSEVEHYQVDGRLIYGSRLLTGLPTQAIIIDFEDPERRPWVLDIEVIDAGLVALLKTEPLESQRAVRVGRAILAMDAGDIDADDADVIVQYALFGEIVYG